MDIKISIEDLMLQFLIEKFPYHDVEFIYYSPNGPQPGDYKAPYFKINDHTIGWLFNNKTEFCPYSAPNARNEFKTIKVADPRFIEIFHKMAVYELGYDPLRPGSREAFMNTSILDYEKFHQDLYEIYYSLR